MNDELELDKLRAKFQKKDPDVKPVIPEPYHRWSDISDTMAEPAGKHKNPKINDGRIDTDQMAETVTF